MPKGTRSGGVGDGPPTPDSQVLATASRLLAEHGFDGLEPAGGLSEWELFSTLMREDETRFNEMVAGHLDEVDTAAERLTALIEACVVEYDWSLWIELWSLALRDERARTLRRELDRDFRERIDGLISEGVERGEFQVKDRPATTMAIATLIDSMAVQATLRDTTVSPNYMFRACVSVAGSLLGASLSLRGRDGGGS